MRCPDVELSLPNVNVRPLRSARLSASTPAPTMKTDRNRSSLGRCAIALAPETALRAWTPVSPPYQARWMSPFLKPVTTAA